MLQQSSMSLHNFGQISFIQYGTQFFEKYAETIDPPEESFNELSAIAKAHGPQDYI